MNDKTPTQAVAMPRQVHSGAFHMQTPKQFPIFHWYRGVHTLANLISEQR